MRTLINLSAGLVLLTIGPAWAAPVTIDYTYDDLNRLQSVEMPAGDITYTFDEIGNILSENIESTSTADTTPPSIPSGVTAQALSSSQIQINWALSTDNVGVTGYRIYRNGTEVGTSTTGYFVNNGLSADQTYLYSVRAYDAAGNHSSHSASESATTFTAQPNTQINFNNHTITSYGNNQDISRLHTIEDGGATLRLKGNTWKKINLPYSVTSRTVIEFDFQSPVIGEIHGFGFDADNQEAPERSFQLYGTTAWGVQAYKNYSVVAPNVKHYKINVGTHYTGNMLYLYFITDHDVTTPTAESIFSNVQIYEEGAAPDGEAPSVPLNLTAQAVSATQINLSWGASTDNVSVTGYRIYRNGTDIGLSATTTFVNTGLTAGQTYSYTVRAYDAMDNLSANSNSANATTPSAPTTGEINFNNYSITSYGNAQDIAGTATIEGSGSALRLKGNIWKKINLVYTVTSHTVLEFDFQSPAIGEVHAIGMDSDNQEDAARGLQLYGSQSWGIQTYKNYTASAPNVKHYKIPLGAHYTGSMTNLFFANDHDVTQPSGEAVFSNVRVYEE